jgi:hypothetical protein
MADKQRYWLVWVDDTPVNVDEPLMADAVGKAFVRETEDDPDALIEVKMCTRADLDWAHITDGIGADELDDEDEEGQQQP